MQPLGVDRAALKSAARAAIVITVVFAFADKVIGNLTTAPFATFGSFALLVLTHAPPRATTGAYEPVWRLLTGRSGLSATYLSRLGLADPRRD